MNFLSKIEKYKSNVCIIDENKKKSSYTNILKQGENISKDLFKRSLILILAENTTEFIASYISFFRKGLVQMLVNSDINNEYLKALAKTYKPNYIFLSKSKVISLPNYQVFKILNKNKILKSKKKKEHLLFKDLSLLLSTSGTTGSKKFVKISYDNIYDNTKNIVKSLNIKKTDRTITTMQPFYSYGLSIINTHLFTGASIVLNNFSVIEKKFWNLAISQNITNFGGVPYTYEILKKIKFDKINLPNLKYLTQAGGPLNQELINYYLDYAKKKKIKFIIMYGQTEASPRMTYLPYRMSKNKIGSIGIPIPGGKIFINNNKLNNNEIGEIIYKGKNVFMGYSLTYKDLYKGDENKGILNTGDLGKIDSNGYLYIVGRKSRHIKLYGHRVSLDEIEQILQKKGYNCVCHGTDNNIVIFYVNKGFKMGILNYLTKVIKINISNLKIKKIYKFPLNNNGKISYSILEKYL